MGKDRLSTDGLGIESKELVDGYHIIKLDFKEVVNHKSTVIGYKKFNLII